MIDQRISAGGIVVSQNKVLLVHHQRENAFDFWCFQVVVERQLRNMLKRSIAKSLVESMGGTISIESQYGQGSQLWRSFQRTGSFPQE